MLRRLFAILLAMVAALIIIGFLLPSSVTVERSHSMDHSPEVLFDVLSDMRHFVQWTPWLDQEPDAGYRLEGPPSGVGATLVWREAFEGGASRMWITAVDRPRQIEFQLELGDNDADGYFTIESDGAAQKVSWGMHMRFGTLDLVGRYVGLMLPGLVGRDFSRGLEQLETYLDESPGRVPGLPDAAGNSLPR